MRQNEGSSGVVSVVVEDDGDERNDLVKLLVISNSSGWRRCSWWSLQTMMVSTTLSKGTVGLD